MAEKRPLPRHTLAQSLKLLKAKYGLSGAAIAKQSKPPVDRKTVTNYLRGQTDPRPDKVEAIAKGFDRTAEELLSPTFRPDKTDQNIPKLLEFWEKANEKGRNSILEVAEMAAHSNR